MKRTKYIKTISKDNFEFNRVKFLLWMKMMLSISKEKRESKRAELKIFERIKDFEHSQINSLPYDIYYKPTDILVYDLLQKKDLEKIKNGIFSLFKHNMSHKFVTTGTPQDNISNMVYDLDHTIGASKTWYRVGLFDFANNTKLDRYIHHFEIYLRNFSSSYIAVEAIVTLSSEFQDEIGNFISDDYKKPGMSAQKIWGKNSKKSGARVGYAIGKGTLNADAKNILINEQLQYVKNMFLGQISKFIPIMQYTKGMNLHAINVFETNIDFKKEIPNSRNIFRSLGLDDMYGFFLSDAERLYYFSCAVNEQNSFQFDMKFVFNPNKIGNYAGFISPKDKVLFNLTHNYMTSLYTMVIIKNLSINYSRMISEFRNRENAIKTTRRSHKKLLKLKYEIERAYYSYSKIDHEFSVDEEVKNINDLLEDNCFVKKSVSHGYHPYESFFCGPQKLWKLIKINYDELMADLNNKIDISSSLTHYYDAKKDSRVSWIQLVIAISTFILLIFPEKATVVSNLFLYWYEIFRSIISTVYSVLQNIVT